MPLLSRYNDYLHNNPEGFWFKRKIYGLGWVPVLWQGWVTIAVFVAVLARIVALFVSNTAPTNSEVTWFLLRVFVSVVLLLTVCYYTGEPLKWQWGIPDKNDVK